MRHLVAALVALCLTGIVNVAAQDEGLPGWFDLTVPGGVTTLEALGISAEERALSLPVLARSLDEPAQHVGLRRERLAQVLAAVMANSDESIAIPAPLDADVWRDVLPPVRPRASRDLFTRIVTDRNALLVATGLVATHPSVRAWLARDRELLRFIYREAAAPFAIVARRLEIDDGSFVVPGGASAPGIWRALSGEAPARAGRFLRALLTTDQGRLAWYYDTIAGLNPEQLSAAWPDNATRLEHATDLYQTFRATDPQWHVHDQPFRRGVNDAWTIVTQVTVSGGSVVSPLPQRAWTLLFEQSRMNVSQIDDALEDRTGISMAWLARATLSSIARERRFRFEAFRFAQRVFNDVAREERGNLVVVLNGLRHARALVFALERMQVRGLDIWAAAVRAARHVSENADDERTAVPAFQAAMALLERMRKVRTLDEDQTSNLVRILSDTVGKNREVARVVGRWIVDVLVPALPPLEQPDKWTGTTAFESTILQALAGPRDRVTRRVEWEGLSYAVDQVAAEHDRLLRMRALLPSPGLDAALASDRPHELTSALIALVYATALGDPDGPASLSPEVVTRHDFGLTATTIIREELPWAPPEEQHGDGLWHAQGSLLSLDLGFSRLLLRRIADQQMPAAPTLSLNDLGTLTRTAALMVAEDLEDRDRDEIAAAIARGRERLKAATTVDAIDALARECRMSSATRQLIPWILSRQPEAVQAIFALRDLMWLGKPALTRAELDGWGVAGDPLDGRRILVMPRPAPWEDYAGRSEAGQVTTQVPDLTLRLVEETAALRLPASLIPPLLGFALEDYWHEVQARFADDWLRLTRQAALVEATRVHDYVAALTGDGPLRTER